jgi:glycosyltransferase involved in cell wall biosynthesis
LLAEAVRSILDQTYRALEIIIIDNGSDSEHWNELSRIGNSHDSINLVRLQSNRGPGYARNIGISKSKGDWILFLDDDDILSLDFIEACFESLAVEGNAEMVIGRAVSFKRGFPISYPRDALGAINLKTYKKDPITTLLINGMPVDSCIVKKKVIGSLRFREDIWRGEDTIFWFSLMQKIETLATTNIAFVGIRQHHDQITLKNILYNQDGSPSFSKETYIKIMIDSMEARNQLNMFTLKIIFKRLTDNSRYSLSMVSLLMSKPHHSIRIITMVIKKRLYKYGIMLTDRILKRKPNDFKWLQSQ